MSQHLDCRSDISLSELLRRFRAPCILCGGPQAVTGVFQPSAEAARRMTVGLNRRRLTLYSLCHSCASNLDIERIEEILVQPRRPIIDLGTSPRLHGGEDN
jgi:hypothetical protein